MPIVTIRSLPPGPADRTIAATRIADAIAAAASVEPSDIWIVWADIAPGGYVAAGEAPREQPASTHPPLVEISSGSGRSPEIVDAMLAAAARAIGEELGLPEQNVRVVYAEVPPRRIYSRGRYQ